MKHILRSWENDRHCGDDLFELNLNIKYIIYGKIYKFHSIEKHNHGYYSWNALYTHPPPPTTNQTTLDDKQRNHT